MEQQVDDITVFGGCHCRAVRFEAQVKTGFEIVECNCSICTLIVLNS